MQLRPFSSLADSQSIYLDHNATTPLAGFLPERLLEWAQAWGNPGSIHRAGRRPKALMREARHKIAQLIQCDPLEIVFTAGGSEANNLALKGIFAGLKQTSRRDRDQLIISAVEHPSVRRTAEFLAESQGLRLDILPVGRSGEMDLAAYQSLLSERTALVSVMYANNETGHIFPIKKMAAMAHEAGALFHTDAVQALGKIPVNLRALGVDLASFAGHKFYALKGAGVLYVHKGSPLESLIHGGGQERHRRGGTENVLAIASLGAMAEYADEVIARGEALAALRDQLEQELLREIPGLQITGREGKRLPNASSMIIPGVDGETLLMTLDMKGFAVSTGAACSSGSPEPSPVLLAMGLSREEAQSSLRVGLGWGTTPEQLKKFVATLKEVVAHLRSLNQAFNLGSEGAVNSNDLSANPVRALNGANQ